MEFREDNWVNLYYLTSLAEYKDLEQVRQRWGLEKDQMRKEEVEKELERFRDLRIVREKENSYRANMKSQPFIDELKTFNMAENHLEDKEKVMSHLKTLRLEGNRELLLSADQIKKIYSEQEVPRENPMRMLCQVLKTFEEENLPEKARLNQDQAEELIEKTKERRFS